MSPITPVPGAGISSEAAESAITALAAKTLALSYVNMPGLAVAWKPVKLSACHTNWGESNRGDNEASWFLIAGHLVNRTEQPSAFRTHEEYNS
jgi:hypothetical protein